MFVDGGNGTETYNEIYTEEELSNDHVRLDRRALAGGWRARWRARWRQVASVAALPVAAGAFVLIAHPGAATTTTPAAAPPPGGADGYVALPADATVRPSDYRTVLTRSFLLQEDESRRVSDQVEVRVDPYYLVGPQIDNRILCVDPEGNELTTGAATTYEGLGVLQWSTSMLVSAQVTGRYDCSLQLRANDDDGTAYTMIAVKPAMPDTSVGTWLRVSPSNEDEARAWTYPACTVSTCQYVGGTGPRQQVLFGHDVWTAAPEATNVDVLGTFQLTACPAGGSDCRADERGRADRAQIQSYLEVDQLTSKGKLCKAIRTNGTALGQDVGGDYDIPDRVRHLPITYHIVAPVSSECGGSRQFAVSLHVTYQGGNPVKIDSGNLSAVNLVRGTSA